MKIYLDVCCLNRPFDEWSQERVRLEGDCILSILERIQAGCWQLITSEAVSVELEKMQNLDKKHNILKLLEFASFKQNINTEVELRSKELESWGFGLFDAYHLACAEAASADIFLSTDDRLIRTAERYLDRLLVSAHNPIVWFIHFLQS